MPNIKIFKGDSHRGQRNIWFGKKLKSGNKIGARTRAKYSLQMVYLNELKIRRKK
jgi:hypothetical protein